MEVRVRLHWVPFHISNLVVRKALEKYRKVEEVSCEVWREGPWIRRYGIRYQECAPRATRWSYSGAFASAAGTARMRHPGPSTGKTTCLPSLPTHRSYPQRLPSAALQHLSPLWPCCTRLCAYLRDRQHHEARQHLAEAMMDYLEAVEAAANAIPRDKLPKPEKTC